MQENLEKARDLFELGLSQFKCNKFLEAEQSFNQASLYYPNRPSILINLSATLLELGKWKECESICKKVLSIEPNNFDAHLNLGTSLSKTKNKEDALNHLNQALSINPQSSEAWVNKANVFLELDQLNQSYECFNQALKLNPKCQEALIGRGNFFNEIKEYDSAIAEFNRALQVNPSNAIAKWNKSLSLIRLENFKEGWSLYESRWEVPGIREFKRNFGVPLWLGTESLQGKVILIHHEQGYGDTIQFCRYIPIVESMGAKVYFLSPKPLSKIMSSLNSNIEILEESSIEYASALENIDYHCPVMSLAYAIGTTIDTIPAQVPYLEPTQDKYDSWGSLLKEISYANILPRKIFRIGITWRGSGHYAGTINSKRDIPAKHIADLINHFKNTDIEFHSLQPEEEINKEMHCLIHNETKFFSHQQQIKDFNDTAAIICHMNLVVSIDTATAHLSGALNKLTLLLLPDPPDFMSSISRRLSPWYPNTTLLRQNERRDWSKTIHLLKRKLFDIYYGK